MNNPTTGQTSRGKAMAPISVIPPGATVIDNCTRCDCGQCTPARALPARVIADTIAAITSGADAPCAPSVLPAPTRVISCECVACSQQRGELIAGEVGKGRGGMAMKRVTLDGFGRIVDPLAASTQVIR